MMMNRDNDKDNFISSRDNDSWHQNDDDDDGESSGRRGNRYDGSHRRSDKMS